MLRTEQIFFLFYYPLPSASLFVFPSSSEFPEYIMASGANSADVSQQPSEGLLQTNTVWSWWYILSFSILTNLNSEKFMLLQQAARSILASPLVITRTLIQVRLAVPRYSSNQCLCWNFQYKLGFFIFSCISRLAMSQLQKLLRKISSGKMDFVGRHYLIIVLFIIVCFLHFILLNSKTLI